jgi:hypothetical protein
MLRESDIVLALPLPKASGDQNLPQLKASGDHNVAQYNKATFEISKQFMEAAVIAKTPWPIISNVKYSMVDEAWKLAIEAKDGQRELAGAPVGAPSMCKRPGGPSLQIDPQTRDAVRVYCVFCCSIGLMMILFLETSIVKTKDLFNSRALGRWSSSSYCLQIPVGFGVRDGASNSC